MAMLNNQMDDGTDENGREESRAWTTSPGRETHQSYLAGRL